MRIKTFLKLVEISTKAASQFPFIFATLFAFYRYGELNWAALGLFWGSLLFFDMTTTAINNYTDYMKSDNEDYRKNVNVIGSNHIPLWQVRLIIIFMLSAAIALGIILFFKIGPFLLILGVLSFFVGIFYTFGPIPFSRMPLGEILSGFFMGFIIPYLAVYIHQPSIASLSLQTGRIVFSVDLWETLVIFIVSLPFVLSISNLMLANNICDMDQDKEHDRFLLPYYLGLKKSLFLFRWSYYFMYVFIVAAVALKILPWVMLAILPLALDHYRLGKGFTHVHIKAKTFIFAVKGLNRISMAYIALMGLGIILSPIL